VEAKQIMGDERFNRAFAEGQAMTPGEAVKAAIAPIEIGGETTDTSGFDALAIKLSPREREVLRLVVPGLTAKEIGDALFISESTVRTHQESIKNKLGVRNLKEMVGYAVQHRLV
jgi:DNA-binding NarL/FixJ family response regulator